LELPRKTAGSLIDTGSGKDPQKKGGVERSTPSFFNVLLYVYRQADVCLQTSI